MTQKKSLSLVTNNSPITDHVRYHPFHSSLSIMEYWYLKQVYKPARQGEDQLRKSLAKNISKKILVRDLNLIYPSSIQQDLNFLMPSKSRILRLALLSNPWSFLFKKIWRQQMKVKYKCKKVYFGTQEENPKEKK